MRDFTMYNQVRKAHPACSKSAKFPVCKHISKKCVNLYYIYLCVKNITNSIYLPSNHNYMYY